VRLEITEKCFADFSGVHGDFSCSGGGRSGG